MSSIFYLKQEAVLLAVLDRNGGDFPWHEAAFEPTPAFEALRPVFKRELELLEAEKWQEWDELYATFKAQGIHLFEVDSATRIDEFILHIQGDEAWFRY